MKLHQTQTEFNCGIDLHARSMYVCVMDREGNILVHRNVRGNDFGYFLKLVEPYRQDLTVACECTFSRVKREGVCRSRCSLLPVAARLACSSAGRMPAHPRPLTEKQRRSGEEG